jgi:hypothetical protein
MPSIDGPTTQRVKQLVNFLTSHKAYKPTSSPGQQVSSSQSSFLNQPLASVAEIQFDREQLSLVSACNELVGIAGVSTNFNFSALENSVESWKLLRAGLLATIYGRSVDKATRSNFRHNYMNYTKHDDVPINRNQFPFQSRVIHEEVLWGIERLYNIHSGFSHFHISTQRPNLNTPSMFENFLQHVNGSVKAYSPSQIQVRDSALTRRGTINDFPGPGFIIDGLGKAAELFPKEFIESSYPQISKPSSELTPKDAVENKFRKVLVNSERDLKDTQFAVFRGIKIITNPKKMVIDGRSYALIIYNDHFHNEDQEIAFLVPHGIVNAFLKNPLEFVNAQTNFHPNNLMQKYGPEIIVPVYESALGGFDKTFPFNPGAPLFYNGEPRYDKWGHEHKWHLCYPEKRLGNTETYDTKGYIHRTHDFAGLLKPGFWHRGEEHDHYWSENYDYRNYAIDKLAHDEVRNCLFFAMSQYDLLKSAFRLNTFGHEYNTRFKKWTRDEFKMLRTAIGLRESERYSANEKPVLVGVEQSGNSRFREDFIRQGSFLDTKYMLWNKASSDNTKVDTKMVPGEIPESRYDLKNAKSWEYFAGAGETKNWLDLQAGLYDLGAEPVFYFGQDSLKHQLMEVVKKSGGNNG